MHSPGAGATGQARLALEHVNDFTSGLFVTCIARHQQHFTQATGAFVLTRLLVAADVAVLELHSSLASGFTSPHSASEQSVDLTVLATLL